MNQAHAFAVLLPALVFLSQLNTAQAGTACMSDMRREGAGWLSQDIALHLFQPGEPVQVELQWIGSDNAPEGSGADGACVPGTDHRSEHYFGTSMTGGDLGIVIDGKTALEVEGGNTLTLEGLCKRPESNLDWLIFSRWEGGASTPADRLFVGSGENGNLEVQLVFPGHDVTPDKATYCPDDGHNLAKSSALRCSCKLQTTNDAPGG